MQQEFTKVRKLMQLLLFLFLLSFIAAVSTGFAGQPCESLTNLKLPDTTISSSVTVPAGKFNLITVPGLPAEPSPDLPEFCRVSGSIKPTADSDIRFELWLPVKGWNGKYLQVGNAGFAGMILPTFLTRPLADGYAVAATDNGHQGPGTAWAIGHPEKVIDFAYRAVHLTAARSKDVVKAFYGTPHSYSYFNGCSEGGREALMSAQRYPNDFNGIIAGNPGHAWNDLFFAGVWNARAFQDDPASYMPAAKFQMVAKAAVDACDLMDGVKDGIISDPMGCTFDPADLLCKGNDSENCLTQPQVNALKKIYAGPTNPRTGARINFGLEPGVESMLSSLASAPGTARPPGLADFFFSGMAFEDPKYDVSKLDFDKDVAFVNEKLAFLNATNADLSRFEKSGGKLIHYHGLRDQGVPPKTSIHYFENVADNTKGTKKVQDFYRLFLPPGMGHCFGGPGPNSFGNILAPRPLQSTKETDVQKAIEQWVENGVAPEKIVSTKFTDDDGKKPAVMTRPLCPYPQQARWTGKGSTDDAANFVCKEIKATRKAT